MKKFFLFKRKEIDISSLEASDTGEGLDILSISVDHLAFMTASLGRVNMVFNDATIYEENNLVDGESFKKTSVSVACEAGGEADLIESIMNFVSSDLVKTRVMRFDAVTGNTNVKEADIKEFSDLSSSVRQHPVIRNTGKISKKTFIGGTDGTAFGTSTIIDDIDFGNVNNLPFIDYNETNFTLSGSNITAWANDTKATGGTDYNLTVSGAVLKKASGREDSGIKTDSASIPQLSGFRTSNEILIEGAFTMYVVFGANPSLQDTTNFVPLIYSALPTTFLRTVDQPTSTTNKIIFEDENSFFDVAIGDEVHGGSGLLGTVTALDPDGDNTKEVQIDSSVTITDNDVLTFIVSDTSALNRTCHGFQASPAADSKLNFDIAFDGNKSENINFREKTFYDFNTPKEDRETCFVLVMRRDVNNNLFFHDKFGNLFKTIISSPSVKNTSGAIRIRYIGNNPLSKAEFSIPRFGIIKSDIGRNNSAELAIDLFDKYNP
jgi:hypothetical protein|tara:strand:+ start:642 stop:2117 length:1476 start_codon:yes stop_codon:yes gene_type:complete